MSLLVTGCSVDQTDLVNLSIDTPVVFPAFTSPSDSLRRPRLSVAVSRPSVRVREGFLDNGQPNVDWPIDSIPGPDGTTAFALRRRSANNAAVRWELPAWQASLLFEFPVDDRTIIGLGAHGSSGPSGIRWFAEGRMGIDGATQVPLRFSLGVTYGSHDVRAAYLRRVDGGPPLVSWADGPQETAGLFADVVLVPSSVERPIVPVMGVTLVRQRLLRHRVPSPDPNLATVEVSEWMTLWGVSLGIRGRLSPATDLLVGARLVLDPSIEYAGSHSYLLPLLQLHIHL